MNPQEQRNFEPAIRIVGREAPLAILSRDEHILFHRLLTYRLTGLKMSESKRGEITQLQLDQAIEIARLQAKIERGLAYDVTPDAEQRLRMLLAEDSGS